MKNICKAGLIRSNISAYHQFSLCQKKWRSTLNNKETQRIQGEGYFAWALPLQYTALEFTSQNEMHPKLPEALGFKTPFLKRSIYNWLVVLDIWAMRGSALFCKQSQHGDAFSARQQPLTLQEYKSAWAEAVFRVLRTLGPCPKNEPGKQHLASGIWFSLEPE